MTLPIPAPVPPLPDDLPGSGADFEYRLLALSRGTSRVEIRQLLTAYAEYGHWELARVIVMMNGSRRIWLRRKIIRVMRTG